jgi:hypothetical protein
MGDMGNLFYLTFGQQYAREAHPTAGWIHPDGYVTIDAPDEATARTFAHAWTCGGRFCDLYAEDSEWAPPRYNHAWGEPGYPRGELARLLVETAASRPGELKVTEEQS